MLIDKEKLKSHKIWSEEKRERVLYEIENINYKLEEAQPTKATKKKRVITEAS